MNDTLAATTATHTGDGCLTTAADCVSPRRSWTTRLARSAVLKSLSQLQHAELTLVDDADSVTVGDSGDAADVLKAQVTIHDSSFYRRVMSGGSLGAAEAYLDNLWSCDDLTTLVRIFARNLQTPHSLKRGWSWLTAPLARGVHFLRSNTRRGARRNIHEHYDLGNSFFSLFLDETMMYSAAVFESPEMSLHEASLAKLDLICRKLNLQPGDHVLEIGTGWGGFA